MSTPAIDFVVGWVGGIALVLVGHGFDTTKVKMQSGLVEGGALAVVRQTLATEGIRGLYRGVSSPLVGVAALNATVFVSFGSARRWFDSLYRSQNPSLPSNALLPASYVYSAGAVAGIATAFVEGPVDLFKAMTQKPGSKFASPLHALRTSLQLRGPVGIYQGLTATLLRNIPANAGYFGVYEQLRRAWTPTGKQPSAFVNFMAGGFGGLAYWISSYPMDVIKSKMQMDEIEPQKRQFSSTLDCIRQIATKEGLKGFFRGFTPCVARAFPANAACFATVEAVRSFLVPKL